MGHGRRFVVPRRGYELSAAGQAALSRYVPQLRSLQNSKVVVHGFTDDVPVGPALQRAGIADNLDLSSRRAATVAAFLQSLRRQPEYPVGQRVWRNPPGGA